MTHEIWLRAAVFAGLGLGAGFTSGLFGIGGGIVRIPVFMFLLPVFGVAHPVVMHVAIGTSVALVIPTAIIATRKQYKLGNFDWRFYRTWAIGILAGVVIGMMLIPYLSTEVLKGIFAGFLLAVGCYMGFAKPDMVIAKQPPAGILRAGLGTFVGAFAALTGTGGGAIAGPTLKAFGVPLKKAIATASATGLVVGAAATIAMIIQGWSVPGRPSATLGYVDVVIFAAMLPTTLIGAPLGVKVNSALPQNLLRVIYTILLFVIAAYVISRLVM
jgi:uncharacterized membrane protein YfcA